MKILVTGATGQVGSEVIKKLTSQGIKVLAGVRAPEAMATKDPGVSFVPFDYDVPESIKSALQGVERLFVVLPLHKDMRRYGSRIIEAAKGAGVKLVVNLSCMGADPNAHFQLGKIHGAVDADLEESGLPYITLRAAPFMQNYLTLHAEKVKELGKLWVPERESRTSFIDLRDVAACAASLLTAQNPETRKTYVLTGPAALSNVELAEILSQSTGKSVEYESADIEEYGMALEQIGIPEWNIHMLLSMHRYARSDYTSFKTKAVEYLSSSPAQSFAQFAAEYSRAWS